jgi:CheY-like chemotaxis protein
MKRPDRIQLTGRKDEMLKNTNNIVIADDNQDLLNALSVIFDQHGYTVRTACEGFAALALIRDCAPDFLLSDLNMPGMSGFELLSIVRRRFPEVAVVAMSGEYSGVAIPPDVAADGFYAKGSSNIARLFEILCTVGDAETRRAKRTSTPVWIPAVTIYTDDHATLTAACPECLRAFTYIACSSESQQQDNRCPHCSAPLQLAIVRPCEKTDKTTFLLSTTSVGSSRSTLLHCTENA